MDEGPSRPSRKRSFSDDEHSDKPPVQKRVRFPKAKKVKQGEYVIDPSQQPEDLPDGWKDPLLAAKERATQRRQITTELCSEENRGMLPDIKQAEESYENNEAFDYDGIQMEPFNLEKEREEGYFDAEGNFVEYVVDKEIKDAWLDSIDIETKFTERRSIFANDKDDSSDLSSEAVAMIKRRIADALEPGETVLQALRRLKGTSGGKKEKMSVETKYLFDQLTEDAMKLMDSGEYNVYDEKQEVFLREAEGYERLAQARRGEGLSLSSEQRNSIQTMATKLVSNGTENGIASSVAFQPSSDNSIQNNLTNPINDDNTLDMFAENDGDASDNVTLNESNLVSGFNQDESGTSGNILIDYVYDDSSGYYYSSSLGYYYDPSSGLYCCAASGQWYSYNEETGEYDDIQQAAPTEG